MPRLSIPADSLQTWKYMGEDAPKSSQAAAVKHTGGWDLGSSDRDTYQISLTSVFLGRIHKQKQVGGVYFRGHPDQNALPLWCRRVINIQNEDADYSLLQK